MNDDIRAFAVLLGPDAEPELVRATIRMIPGVATVSAQTDTENAASGGDVDEDIPYRRPEPAVRVRARFGEIRRGRPTIHPDDLGESAEEGEVERLRARVLKLKRQHQTLLEEGSQLCREIAGLGAATNQPVEYVGRYERRANSYQRDADAVSQDIAALAATPAVQGGEG